MIHNSVVDNLSFDDIQTAISSFRKIEFSRSQYCMLIQHLLLERFFKVEANN